MHYYPNLEKTDLGQYFSPDEFEKLKKVEQQFPFHSNEYYLSLLSSVDARDPIRNIIIPDTRELTSEGSYDPSSEQSFTVLPGVQHKYPQTALLLVNRTCAGICRFCFRKRLFDMGRKEETCDISNATEYLSEHHEVNNVLLSGGDPLMLQPKRLDEILSKLRELAHIPLIRIGTKVPAYDPHRILDNQEFSEVLKKHSYPDKKIYVVTQFNHPVELTSEAKESVAIVKNTGVEVINQTPVIRGVNDDPDVLASLFTKLTQIGNSPYYAFQCRPTVGNRHMSVPIEETLRIIDAARKQCNGLAKRVRYIMSHKTGKIEIVGRTKQHMVMKYHQVADESDRDKMLFFKPNPDAYWLEDYRFSLSDVVSKMSWMF